MFTVKFYDCRKIIDLVTKAKEEAEESGNDYAQLICYGLGGRFYCTVFSQFKYIVSQK